MEYGGLAMTAPGNARARVAAGSGGATGLLTSYKANRSSTPPFQQAGLPRAVEREALSTRLALATPGGAIAALPIRHAGELVGVLYLDSVADSDALRRSDREHLLGVAGIVGCLLAIP